VPPFTFDGPFLYSLIGVKPVVYRLILPDWVKAKPDYNVHETPPVLEGKFTPEEVQGINEHAYNAYYLPNYPSCYNPEENVHGSQIDTFTCVFVDMDLKHGEHLDKDAFIKLLLEYTLPPSRIVDSGNGVHAYWDVSDLDPMSFLRLQRRLCRHFKSDPAVSKLYQLMRVPGTINWKHPEDLKLCELVYAEDAAFTCEQLDKALPRITPEDEVYCKAHFDKTHGLTEKLNISDDLPAKWFKFAKKGTEAHRLFYGQVKDRSASDFRLAHLMLGAGFTKEEAMSVLCQTNKATDRVGVHRYNYAEGIVGKVYLAVTDPVKAASTLSKSVRDLLATCADDETLKGVRFECSPLYDATDHGFRLGQVLGAIGGAGSGKTMFGFNLFLGFAERNPDYIHLAVTLEQPELEYAQRWKKVAGANHALYDCVHILGNYNDDGTYRNLSLEEIEDYVKHLEKTTGKKVGCVMIDHIGVLKKETRNGEMQGLMDVCQYMKAFAVNTNTFLVMQSQTSRDKAGIGDIELDKDAAFGTSNYEWFCDYVMTIWQPLKRLYETRPDMTVTVFKFCKIRHKNVKKDRIKEDVRYPLMFDPDTERLTELTPDQYKSFDFVSKQATMLRNRDKKREPGAISVIDWTNKGVVPNGRDTNSSGKPGRAEPSKRVPTH
jgi:hypothetical protein